MENQTSEAIRSSYLKYLPALYSEDEFMGRFLRIFESILEPIERIVGQIDIYLDPRMMPPEFLPWIASWLDLALDENWPEKKRRSLISSVVELYRWRGTHKGLREYLKIYTGVEPFITEHFGGIKLHSETRLGHNTFLGTTQGHSFTVTLQSEGNGQIDKRMEHTVKTIIEAEKPAHTAYTLIWVPKSDLASPERGNTDVAD